MGWMGLGWAGALDKFFLRSLVLIFPVDVGSFFPSLKFKLLK